MSRPIAKRSSTLGGWFIGANHIGDYMHRWLLQTPWFSLRLHHILRSDKDTELHDHPWSFVSFLVSGGYTEVTASDPCRGPQVETYHPRWSLLRRRAETPHRLILREGPVWTVVVAGPPRRPWGFYAPSGWVYWRKFLGLDGGAP